MDVAWAIKQSMLIDCAASEGDDECFVVCAEDARLASLLFFALYQWSEMRFHTRFDMDFDDCHLNVMVAFGYAFCPIQAVL